MIINQRQSKIYKNKGNRNKIEYPINVKNQSFRTSQNQHKNNN